MKIDGHIHITPPDLIKNAKKIGEKEPYFNWLSNTEHNKFATIEQTIQMLEDEKFDHGVVFGFAFNDTELCKYVNDYVIDAVKKYGNKITGFMVLSPQDKKMDEEIERCYNAGLRGIGELFPEGQKWNLYNVHEKTPLKKYAIKYSLPILLHTNEPIGHLYAGKTNTTHKEVESFILNHQDVDIILAHFGGGLLFYETMKENRCAFKNVYYDTAAGVFLYDETIYKAASAINVIDKIVFGSDYPLLKPSRYEKMLNDSNLSSIECDKIMGDTLKNVLKL
ncbi:MAG: amidohydrolase family protein [Cellulosilyticaceae bacterium]